jgi:hypothetical protein
MQAKLTPAEQYLIEDTLPIGNKLRAKVIKARMRKAEMSGISVRVTNDEARLILRILPYYRDFRGSN